MSNTREMTSNALETLYRVMLKRISKRLSAEKLSFLIGRPADYVSNIENAAYQTIFHSRAEMCRRCIGRKRL